MSDGGRLFWIVGVFAATTVGVLIGIWIGGDIETGIYEDILKKTNLRNTSQLVQFALNNQII